jgi:hypothetical protein
MPMACQEFYLWIGEGNREERERRTKVMAMGFLFIRLALELKIKILSVRLHHSPDASTFPGFKLMCFVYIIYFSEIKTN